MDEGTAGDDDELALTARALDLAARDRESGRLPREDGAGLARLGPRVEKVVAVAGEGSDVARALAAEHRRQEEVDDLRRNYRLALRGGGSGVVIVAAGTAYALRSDGPGIVALWLLWATAVGVAILSVVSAEDRAALRRTLVALVAARQRVDERLRGIVDDLAFHLHDFVPDPPTQDRVEIDALAVFATRTAERSQVLEVGSIRAARQHLARRGGAVLGISGERGSGKSELIRTLCRSPEDETRVPVVGAFVTAPTAPDVEAFTRVVVTAVCEAVPRFTSREAWIGRLRRRAWRISLAAAGGIAAIVGWARLAGGRWPDPDWPLVATWGAALGGATLTVTVLAVAIDAASYARVTWSATRDIWARHRPWKRDERPAANRVRPSIFEAAALEQDRARALRSARQLHHEVRHLETLTTRRELGAGRWGLTAGAGSERALAAIPLTTTDLVNRLGQLVATIGETASVVVGLDELDRLEAGDQTDRFLNGIKQLFTVPCCSFLVSLSDSARVQFSRQGVDIMGVLDSSFDEVVEVSALDAHAARHLIRRRGELSMSDTQVLLCLALAGGRPRELLRQARALAGTQRGSGVVSTAVAAERMVDDRWHRLREDAADLVTSWERHPGRSALLIGLDGLTLDAGTRLVVPPADPRWQRLDEARMLVDQLAARAQVLATIGAVFGTEASTAPPPAAGDQLAAALRAVDEDPIAGRDRLAAVRATLGLPERDAPAPSGRWSRSPRRLSSWRAASRPRRSEPARRAGSRAGRCGRPG